MIKYRIVYFPWEQKYSIWDNNYNLIKEWFHSYDSAQHYIDNILKKHNEQIYHQNKNKG